MCADSYSDFALGYRGQDFSRNNAIVKVVRLFAVFHDSRREDDSLDYEHGRRGAKYGPDDRHPSKPQS